MEIQKCLAPNEVKGSVWNPIKKLTGMQRRKLTIIMRSLINQN